MARVKALSAYKMAKRIYNREDNVYDDYFAPADPERNVVPLH